jgi:uncharacterized protein (DUF1501 family)
MTRRRVFLRDGALAIVGLSTVPGFLVRALAAAEPAKSKKTLVVLFQRGAADGLNMVVPFGEPAYYDYRPTIGVPPPGKGEGAAIDLDGKFGLHPSLQGLAPLYKEGRLAIINAVGSPDTGGRSHFQAQDIMESAAPGNRTVTSGWLNRYLEATPQKERSTLRATAIGDTLPKTLRGPVSVMTLGNLNQLELLGADYFTSAYSADTNALISGTAREMFEAVKQLKAARLDQFAPANGVNYGGNPNNPGSLGGSLAQVARLIKANVGLQIAFIDVSGGWDTHANQSARLPGLLGPFGQAIAAFHRDLGDRMENIVLLTMSEFGRTARENGNGGTDHGHANVMFVSGGPIKGGKMYGTWPGLAKEQLNEDRDLALTTDFRDVLAEVIVRHLDCEKPAAIFPKYGADAARFKGFI